MWSSGNGGRYSDSCACDGYVNNIYTFAISGITERHKRPAYLEECASVLATVYSSGNSTNGERDIATTDVNHSCTLNHTATSAAAPIAAGIIALTLEANPGLTWRDVMYLIVLTAKPEPTLYNEFFINKFGLGCKLFAVYTIMFYLENFCSCFS